MDVRKIATIVGVLLLVVSCGSLKGHPHSSPITNTENQNKTKAWVPHTWHVGNFTISTRLLPKFFDSFRWVHRADVEASTIYYVSKSEPTELVGQSLSTDQTKTVANLNCAATWQGSPTEVDPAGGSYELVQCGTPPTGTARQGILVDLKTGTTRTLWKTSGGTQDGTFDGQAVVSDGWVYFADATPGGAQGAMDLATGVTKPLPYPLTKSFPGYLAPDGTLYAQVIKWQSSVANPSENPADLYRVTGLKSTLVAHLPAALSGIAANGTIWVPQKGGSLTSNAAGMAIRVWDSGVPPGFTPGKSPSKSTKVLTEGPGYIIYLSPATVGAMLRVTLANASGSKTITVGPVNWSNTTGTHFGAIFEAPNGRWQVLTISSG